MKPSNEKRRRVVDYFLNNDLKSSVYFETSKGVFGVSLLSELDSVFQQINLDSFSSFLDLGSGDGRVVILASLYTKSYGVEFEKSLYDISFHKKNLLKDAVGSCEFLNDDFFSLNLNEYDLVYINPDRPFYRDDLEKFLLKFNTNFLIDISLFEPRFMKISKKFEFYPKKYGLYLKKE